ncbi:DUF211 domain-containing protein [Methanococcoides methylutens]|uniref:DUF211 domain-containing protein n=1 Tax=Methanococcoides methylutens MM1 TaxID=1434104 RepID=A0A0E3ST51_METMT|nr:DUF211 domain-containing protein [Methanococcoides methylutens]AKB85712.1 hypothetical protein MCMEM_1659 [Methanococcoides methylutens MM1]
MNKLTGIRRLVLDVLKPHHPSTIELAETLGVINGITGVNIGLYEVDQKTENIKITIEGDQIDYNEVRQAIEKLGAVVHSIDEVAAGNRLVEEVPTLQDR